MEVDAANAAAEEDASEYILKAAMIRIKDVIALISRTHGELKSLKKDAMAVRSEGDVGGSSLYTKLTSNGYYRTLVAEYWATIDQCDIRIPLIRKHTRLTLKYD